MVEKEGRGRRGAATFWKVARWRRGPPLNNPTPPLMAQGRIPLDDAIEPGGPDSG